MNPQIKSILTSVLLAGATAATTWGAAHGIIPNEDQTGAANLIVTIALGVISAGIGYYKQRQVTPTNLIKSVNAADNGVKVVPTTSPTPPVQAPMK